MCNRNGNCQKCLFSARCGGCSHCEAQLCNKNCHQCGTLCPSRAGAHSLILALGGPSFSLTAPCNPIMLPCHIPVIPDRLKTSLSLPFVSVHGGNLLARNGSKVNKSYLNKGVSGALNLSGEVDKMVEFYIKDRQLEGFWDNRKDVYIQLKSLNFKTILSPNFSLYDDAPRLEHLYNTKRSVAVYNEMLDVGLPAVPDVSWHNSEDIDVWIREINASKIPVIGFSFQNVDVRQKASYSWKTMLPGFQRLCNSIDPDTQIVLVGITSPTRVKAIHDVVKQPLRVLNQSAYIQAQKGMRSEGRIPNFPLSKFDLLSENLSYFNKIYSSLNESKMRGY